MAVFLAAAVDGGDDARGIAFNDDRDTLSRLPTSTAKDDRLAWQVADLICDQRWFFCGRAVCPLRTGDR